MIVWDEHDLILHSMFRILIMMLFYHEFIWYIEYWSFEVLFAWTAEQQCVLKDDSFVDLKALIETVLSLLLLNEFYSLLWIQFIQTIALWKSNGDWIGYCIALLWNDSSTKWSADTVISIRENHWKIIINTKWSVMSLRMSWWECVVDKSVNENQNKNGHI